MLYTGQDKTKQLFLPRKSRNVLTFSPSIKHFPYNVQNTLISLQIFPLPQLNQQFRGHNHKGQLPIFQKGLVEGLQESRHAKSGNARNCERKFATFGQIQNYAQDPIHKFGEKVYFYGTFQELIQKILHFLDQERFINFLIPKQSQTYFCSFVQKLLLIIFLQTPEQQLRIVPTFLLSHNSLQHIPQQPQYIQFEFITTGEIIHLLLQIMQNTTSPNPLRCLLILMTSHILKHNHTPLIYSLIFGMIQLLLTQVEGMSGELREWEDGFVEESRDALPEQQDALCRNVGVEVEKVIKYVRECMLMVDGIRRAQCFFQHLQVVIGLLIHFLRLAKHRLINFPFPPILREGNLLLSLLLLEFVDLFFPDLQSEFESFGVPLFVFCLHS